MANDYDVGRTVLEVLDSYMDTKAKERIAYAKLNKPEIRTVDDRLYSIDPTTNKATDITPNTTAHYFTKAQESVGKQMMQWNSPTQVLSTAGVTQDINNYLLENPMDRKDDLALFNSGPVKRYSDIAEFDVAGKLKSVMLRENIPTEVWENKFGAITFNKDTMELEASGELENSIRSASLSTQKQLISNANKFATNWKRNARATNVANAGKRSQMLEIKRRDMDAMRKREEKHFNKYLTWLTDESGKKLNIDDIRAGRNITPGLIDVVNSEAEYLRALTGQQVVTPINVYQYQDNAQNAGRIMADLDTAISQDSATANQKLKKEFVEHEGGPITVNGKKGYLKIHGLAWINELSQSYWKNNSQIIKTLPYVHKELWFHYKPDDVAKIILGHKKILSDEVKVNQALLGIPTQE